MLALLVVRTIPIVAHGVALGEAPVGLVLCAIGTWGAALSVATYFGALSWMWLAWALGGYGYFLAAAALAELGRRLLAKEAMSRLGLFAAFVLLLVLVPAYLFRGPMQTFVVAVGWERVLAGFSYCVDNRRSAPSWQAALFFLWANPALVWSQQGSRLASPQLRLGLLRMASGVAVLVLGEFIRRGLQVPLFQPTDLLEVGSAREGVRFFVSHFAIAAEFTCAHAGLASLQIGALLLFGYRVPERYFRPLLSTSPAVFWRRWNIWVGDWARKYLFRPMVHLLRGRLSKHHTVVSVIAVTYTFVALGALHDLAVVAIRLANGVPLGPPAGTLLFFGFALTYVLWEAASRAVLGGFKTSAPQGFGHAAPVVGLLQWAILLSVMLIMVWFAVPALGGQIPRSLDSSASIQWKR